jgi:DNA polymerase I-like protein with 3'-5' exonuclease and polymerase domains
MKSLILDVENTVTKRDGKLHLDPFEPNNSLVMVGAYPDDGEPEIYTFDHVEYVEHMHERKAHVERIQKLLDECSVLVGHNIGHDLQWLWATGFKYDGDVWDTMLGEYILQRGQKEPLSLEAVAERRDLEFKKQDTLKQYMKQGVAIDEIPIDELKEYLYGDLRTTHALYNEQRIDYRAPNNAPLLPIAKLTMQTAYVLTKIYRNGFTVDSNALEKVRDEFETEKSNIEKDLNKHVRELMGDTPINLNSPEQLSWVIYSRKPKDKTQWANDADPYMSPEAFRRFVNGSSSPVRKTKAEKCHSCNGSGFFFKRKKDGSNFKNPTKCPTCSSRGYVLKELPALAGLKFNAPSAKWHSANGFTTSKISLEFLENVATGKGMEEAAVFLYKLRRLSALDTYLSSFVDGIRIFTKRDNRLHVRLTQHMTSTGRFSGRDPNMQNMPRGGTFPVKKVFVSRWDGGKIMEADFAQLEFRVAAFLSQDETAIKEVTEGFDVHSYTSQVISEAGQATSRQAAKAHTFAPLYGATGFGRTPAEAAYYTHFTEKYKGIARWHRELAKEVLSTGKIRTPSGREFVFKDVKRRRDGTVTNFTAIKNYPVQSFATADIVPAVLIEIDKKLALLQSMIVNSVHDSIVIDVHPDEERLIVETIAQINSELINIINNKFNINFNVPLLLEAKMGVNWLVQKEV